MGAAEASPAPAAYESLIRTHIRPALGAVPLALGHSRCRGRPHNTPDIGRCTRLESPVHEVGRPMVPLLA